MALAENGGPFPLTKAKYSFNVEVHEIDHQDEGELHKLNSLT
jgi:hypothetical protein